MADRKLAAIMFTDIAGYTSLMGSDENRAFEILNVNMEIHQLQIKRYGGNLIKEMGDGILASFSSAYDAVKCAIAIQEDARLENINLRIGIHEADIVFKKGDILGDGVNVASRLQEMADVGGVYISGTVYNEIKNKPSVKTSYVGDKNLKNVEEPVKVHEIIYREKNKITETRSSETVQKPQGKKKFFIAAGLFLIVATALIIGFYLIKSSAPDAERLVAEKSIAVRPFWNESPDQENEYFLNGMAEEIRNNLSKVSDLRVVSRGSMEKYRGSTLTNRQIAYEQNVNYVLEGSGQKIGDHLRIHLQLIYVSNEEDHFWQNSYEREITDVRDIFVIQREVAEIVARELYATITPEEENNIKSNPTTSLTAYDFYLQAREAHIDFWKEGANPIGLEIVSNDSTELESAVRNYRRALEYDSTFARAYVGLAMAYWDEYRNTNMLKEDYLDTLLVLAELALSFDPNLEEAYYIKGLYYQKARGDLALALSDYQKALEINPNYARVYYEAGNMYNWNSNDFINGFTYLNRAIELDRGYLLPFTLNALGNAYLFTGFENKALEYFQQSFEISNDTSEFYWNMAFREWSMGNIKKSLKWAEEGGLLEYLAIRNSFIGNTKEAYKYFMEIMNPGDQQDTSNFNINSNHRIAYILWENDQKDLARYYFDLQIKILRKLIELNREPSVRGFAQYDLAAIYAFREEYDSTFYYLGEIEKRETYPAWLMTYFKYDPLTESIRSDPRFQSFLLQAETKFQHKHDELEAWLKAEGLLDINENK